MNIVVVIAILLALVGIYFAYKKKAWESIISFLLTLFVFLVGIAFDNNKPIVPPESTIDSSSLTLPSNISNKDIPVPSHTLNNSEIYLTDLLVSEQSGQGSVGKIKLDTDIFGNVYRNCYGLGWEDYSGGSEAYIEFVLNKKYKSFFVTLIVPKPKYDGDFYRGNIYVEILNDSKVIYTSPTLNQKVKAINVLLDVSGQNFLRINKKPRSLVSVLLANAKVSEQEITSAGD
jgi:hypothetical protein